MGSRHSLLAYVVYISALSRILSKCRKTYTNMSNSEQSRRIDNIRAEIRGNQQRLNLADISSDERAALVRKNQELQRRIEGLKQEITLLDYQQRLAEMKAKDDARRRKLRERAHARKLREAAKKEEL